MRKLIALQTLLTLILGGHATPGFTEVAEVSDLGFHSRLELELNGSPQEVYQLLTGGISLWWDGAHTYTGDSGRLRMADVAGGCFCEQLNDGGSVEHGRVVYAAPGSVLRLSAALGPLQELGVNGSLSFLLSATDNGLTRINYRYVVGGYAPGGLSGLAQGVDEVMTLQLMRLQRYLATGNADPAASQ